MIGKIRNYNAERGFGFVRLVEAHVDYFFNTRALLDDVAPGDVVEFWLGDNPRRAGELCAVDVKRIDTAEVPKIPQLPHGR
jgi:cold shock CspA family protein